MSPRSVVPRHFFQQMDSILHRLPFTVAYKTPKNMVPVTTTFESLKMFQLYFHGWLFKNPDTNHAILPEYMNHSHADSSVVYLAEHPMYTAREQGIVHHQISDKAFEEKAIKAVERHLCLHGDIRRFVATNPTRRDGWRYIAGETNIAEWDGIWEDPDEFIYFLETKHFVDGNKIVHVDQKLKRSLKFLGKSAQMATVYIAGKYWSTELGVVDFAQKLGFGVVEENGINLEVKDPIGGLEVGHKNAGQVVVEAKKRGRPRKVK